MAVQNGPRKNDKKLKKKKRRDRFFGKNAQQKTENKEPTEVEAPSLIYSSSTEDTARQDDTMKDVASIVMESGGASLKSDQDTNRQLAGLFSHSDYQKLVEEMPSNPMIKSEPVTMDEHVRRLEEEIRQLKELVDQQAAELYEARKRVNNLMMEYQKGETNPEPHQKANSEPRLMPQKSSNRQNTV